MDKEQQLMTMHAAVSDYQGLHKVTRVEIITDKGREASVAYVRNLWIDIQDGGKTMKLFCEHMPKVEEQEAALDHIARLGQDCDRMLDDFTE